MLVKSCLSKIVYTNWLIAFAALSQSVLTYYLIERPINVYIVAIEWSSTLLLYNFSLYLAKPKNPQNSKFERTRWVFSHMWIFYSSSLLGFTILVYSLMHIHELTVLYLGFVGACSLLYSIPIIRWKGRAYGLRNVPFIKLFHIAFIWTLSTVLLPLVELYSEHIYIDLPTIIYMCMMKFVLIMVCTLPFDIRDAKQDALYQLKTLPTYFGESKSRKLTYVMFSLHSVLILFSPFTLQLRAGLLLANAVIFLLLRYRVFTKNTSYEHVYLLDLFLVLQMIIVVVIDQMTSM